MKLTLPQQDVYFEQFLYPNDPIYNIGAKIAIEGPIDFDMLNKAYQALIEQHDAYRGVLVHSGEEVQFQILPSHDTELELVDYTLENEAKKQAEDFMQKAFKVPFDLLKEEFLYRFVFIKLSDRFSYLFSVYHHIIVDGWGASLMFQRLVKNYNELLEKKAIESQYLFSYNNFAIDDNQYYHSEAFQNDKAYWEEKFDTIPERLFKSTIENDFLNQSKRKSLSISRMAYQRLVTIAQESKGTTFHVILALLYYYFGSRCQNHDFAIGIPVLNRGKAIFKKTVGLFMGMNALRIHLNMEDTFFALVRQIREQLRKDYRHQRFPLGKLVQALNIPKGGQALFDISLSYEKQDYASHFTDTKTTVTPMTHESERLALAIYIREFDEGEDVNIDFDYNVNYFGKEEITQVITHIEGLIKQVSIEPDKPLLQYDMMSNAERKQLLHGFNQTQYTIPHEDTFLTYFERQVINLPNKLAVFDPIKRYSYQQLNEVSNHVANYLTQKTSINVGCPVAVMMSRSVDMVAVLLGILKTGRPYIPLDPTFPKARLDFIIEQSGVAYVIGDECYENRIEAEVIFISAMDMLNALHPSSLTEFPSARPSNTAYIIYTSGSTGQPKGVAIAHRALLNFLLSMRQKPGLADSDCLYSVTTQSFDISILEFFGPLISGASVYIADAETLANPLAIIKELAIINPSVIQATPSFYQMLINAGWTGHKQLKVLCGGDLFSEALALHLLTSCEEVWNMYGPTETTIWSSCQKLTSPKQANNIGKPIANTSFYVLDEYKRALPVGVIGDIYIGGEGLAKGYFNDEALTNQRFVSHPFMDGQKLYQTGDLGRWNTSGELEFLGRNDHQVKVRGFRIELGEIENKLEAIEAIKSAVVIAKKDSGHEATLVAYVVSTQNGLDTDAIVQTLHEELPRYMVPHAIIPLERLPLTPNNKVDRKSLALRPIAIKAHKPSGQVPSFGLEAETCGYFQEILKLEEPVSPEDDFFRLGGHSLSAVRLIGLMHENLGYQLSLKEVFDYPTPRLLAKLMEKAENERLPQIEPVADREFYPVTLPQYAIWLASMNDEKSIAYNMSMAFDIIGQFELPLLEKAIMQVIEKYESLRTNFLQHDGMLCQHIKRIGEVGFQINCFEGQKTTLTKSLEGFVNQKFDLETDMLLRVGVFCLPNQNDILVFTTHHTLMDGWSLEILINEVVERYHTMHKGMSIHEDALKFQFKDYAVWQKGIAESTQDTNRVFWKHYLKGYQWKSLIPHDHIKADGYNTGTFFHFHWDEAFLTKIGETAQKYGLTLHTLLVGAFGLSIQQIKSTDDVCIGTINAGRPYAELRSQIGMFVKTLPLRMNLSPNQTVDVYFKQLQTDLLVIDKHQDMPEDIMRLLLLEAIFVLQNPSFDYRNISITDGFALKARSVNPWHHRLPLLVDCAINDGRLEGVVHYDTGKYALETVELLIAKFEKIIQQIIGHTEMTIAEIDAELDIEKEENIDIMFNF